MSSGAHIHHPIAQTRRSIAPAALLLLAALSAASQTPRAPQSSHALETYAALPIAFEANAGQSDHRVKFLAHARSYTLFLTGDEAVLSLPSHAIHLKFLGAAQPSLTGRNQLPGKTNYFLGNDPKQWHTNVPNYSAVEYHTLYPGIDAVFHGDNHRLEFDFNLAPNANPHSIALEVEGAHHLRLNPSGDIVLSLNHAPNVILDKPHIYQPTPQGPREISGHYILTASNRIAFALGPYDHAQPLVIDPTITYSTYLGGNVEDFPNAIAADSSGSAYLAGEAFSPNFPVTNGAYQTSCTETGKTTCTSAMAYVAKLSPDGSSLVYATFLNGHSAADSAWGIAVDPSGSAYVIGEEQGELDFPTTTGAFQPACNVAANMQPEVFVAKLDPTGSILDYSTCLQSPIPNAASNFTEGTTSSGGIAVDSDGNAYVTGVTDDPQDFPTTQGTFQTGCVLNPPEGCNVSADPFVTKIDPTGQALLYSTFLSTGKVSSEVNATGIAVDSLGNAYVIGNSDNSNLITTPGSFMPSCPSDGCGGFVAKINGNATVLVYSTYLGGSDFAYPTAVAVDQNGSAYVTGYTGSTDFPVTVGALQYYFTPPGALTTNEEDGFVVKVGALGDTFAYATFLAGTSQDTQPSGIAVDAEGHAFVTGIADTGFPTTTNAFQTTDQAGANQAFFSELDPGGASLLYSTFLAGTSGGAFVQPADVGSSYVATDASGNAYVAGITDSSTFPTTPGAYLTNTPLPGGSHAATGFVVKFAFSPTTVLTISPTTLPSGIAGTAYTQTLTATGGTGAVTFDVTTGSPPSGVTLTSTGDLSGTPAQTGTSSFTVTATDSINNTGSQAYTLQIACPTITVGPSTLAPGTAGTPYGPVTFTETGGVGTVTFAVTNTLPAGITFISGVLSGETATQSGTFPFIVTATDSNGCMGTVSDRLVLNPSTQQPAQVNDAEHITVTDTGTVRAFNAIAITPTPASFNASNGTAYQTYPYAPVQFTATGGIGTFTFTEAGALPSGITFTNGTLTGTPAASSAGNSYTFSVTAADADGDQATLQGYTLTVSTSTEPPANINDIETVTVSDTETFPDVVDSEPITVTDTVSVTTSLIITVPNVVGLTQAAATSAITGASLTVGTVTTASSATVPSGSVISQNPAAGSSAAAGSAVNLVVSIGPTSVTVPNVVGLMQAAATSAITGASLTVGTVTTASSATVPSGSVISQNPAAGSSAAAGSAVNLVVSIGPTSVTVSCTIPTINLSGDSATAQITCTATGPTGPIALVCNLPASLSKYITCSFSPNSLSFTSSSTPAYTASTTLTIQAVQSASLERKPRPWAVPSGGVAFGAVLWLPAWLFDSRRKKGKSKRGLLLLFILLCGLPAITSCGGRNGPPTPPAGNYQAAVLLQGPGLDETINFTIQVP